MSLPDKPTVQRDTISGLKRHSLKRHAHCLRRHRKGVAPVSASLKVDQFHDVHGRPQQPYQRRTTNQSAPFRGHAGPRRHVKQF